MWLLPIKTTLFDINFHTSQVTEDIVFETENTANDTTDIWE